MHRSDAGRLREVGGVVVQVPGVAEARARLRALGGGRGAAAAGAPAPGRAPPPQLSPRRPRSRPLRGPGGGGALGLRATAPHRSARPTPPHTSPQHPRLVCHLAKCIKSVVRVNCRSNKCGETKTINYSV